MDRRTKYTQKVIKESLLELLNEKHLNEITVKTLSEKADINRTTFYRNYNDIYEVFEQIEEELIERTFEDQDLLQDRYRLLELIYDNQSFYREFFATRLESAFVKRTIDLLYQQLEEGLKETRQFDESTFQISYRYNYYGFIGVISHWLKEGCTMSPNELGEKLYAIIDNQWR